ncbi:MAG: HU family DNA-binding protein [Candidatus Doudnabacteria bacterium]|nr:HU family DNA-binding protein [Candidatus Doudnabacteria bacterium]
MNKAALIEALAQRTGTGKQDAEKMLDSLVELITETIKRGEEVTITGFGNFSAHNRKGRVGVNPRNITEKIEIPTVRVPKFRAGSVLKKSVRS